MSLSDIASRRRFTELNQHRFSLSLGSFTCKILGWGFLGERWWRNYLHVHSFYEICCAFDGVGVFHINDTDYEVRAGDVFVAKPAESHEIVSSESAPLGIYFWSYTLIPNIVPATHTVDKETQEIDALLHAFCHSRRWVSQHGSTGMLNICKLLTDEVIVCAPGYQRNLDGLIAKLIIDTARAVTPSFVSIRAESIFSEQTPNQQTLKQIDHYLHDNFNRSITIRDVAAQVHLSERHVSRLYHEATGCTIKEQVLALRIEAASQRLLSTDHAIKEIGKSVGFPDVQHFTTLFKRRTGLTPALFRQQRGTRFNDPNGPQHVE